MIATAPASLPESLAARLTEEQRQAVAEAPREKRLAVLATALRLAEPEADAAWGVAEAGS